MTEGKVRENRLRRMAERQGYQLTRTRRRDPRALDYGLYTLVKTDINAALYHATNVTLDEIEAFLTRSGD
jgi:hypothetical protein